MDKFVDFTIKIRKLCGIDLTCYKERQMKRRINALIKRNGLIDYDDYF
ncbi:MAG TPA: chemotaxis protein CheR, partial [Thermoanaerobacterales bacterium]|nr:chemotaxis protein CheR [Thermoanaerobacterales bacterium]